ncbi:MAG: hypothetical protein E6J02_09680 [Chloroflexi bacterium]|nr:MAG: hypothetical protein E6J02_09680 [Chloroflexota bacterium]
MKSSPPSETRPAKRVGSFSRTAESGVGSVIHLRSRSTSRTAQDDQEMALADDPLKRLRSLGWAADGHELDEEVLEAIARLPIRSRQKLVAWLDVMSRELERARDDEDAVGDASQRAVDIGAARERTRLARELHDEIGADLAAAVALFKYYFESAHGRQDREKTLRNIFDIVRGLLTQTRQMMRSMRTHQLGPGGLVGDLSALGEEYSQRHGIKVEIEALGSEDDLTQNQREVIFQVVREALSNVRRHSGADSCSIVLNLAAQPFFVEVSDSGSGVSDRSGEGYGLIGMRERAAGIRGRLQLVSAPGRGTKVFLFGP